MNFVANTHPHRNINQTNLINRDGENGEINNYEP